MIPEMPPQRNVKPQTGEKLYCLTGDRRAPADQPPGRFVADSPLEEGVWSEPVSEVGVFATWELRYSEAFMDDNSSGKGLFRARKRRSLSLCPWQFPPLSGS
jgi:hypothetical protein